MRDMMATKMAELKFEAPLARFEEAEDWASTATGATTPGNADANNCFLQQQANNNNNVPAAAAVASLLAAEAGGGEEAAGGGGAGAGAAAFADCDAFSASLEDLVHTFDEKLARCFTHYDQSTAALAPVQVRAHDDVMTECQMWWTITGNFGNILPIDWSKSCARKLQLSSLRLEDSALSPGAEDELEEEEGLSSEDEAAAADLDMHALILSGLSGGGAGRGRGGAAKEEEEEEPIKTADEVIREIDDLLQESPPHPPASPSPEEEEEQQRRHRLRPAALASPLYEDKLRALSAPRLSELYLELELLIRDFSETLIAELALRDELEYEKELKNSFISLLLAVQNRRRQHHVERKRRPPSSSSATHQHQRGALDPKYLTTVIPYHLGSGPPDNQALQVLIKILKAINEDSPTVPTLLTDYILKVLCPT